MATTKGSGMRVLVVAVAATFATVLAAADTMPKLPGPLALQKSGDSPGQVTFHHETHVDTDRPDCTTCHARLFSIVPAKHAARYRGTSAGRRPIVHAEMEEGRQCGACHNGRQAFAIEDDCAGCHQE